MIGWVHYKQTGKTTKIPLCLPCIYDTYIEHKIQQMLHNSMITNQFDTTGKPKEEQIGENKHVSHTIKIHQVLYNDDT